MVTVGFKGVGDFLSSHCKDKQEGKIIGPGCKMICLFCERLSCTFLIFISSDKFGRGIIRLMDEFFNSRGFLYVSDPHLLWLEGLRSAIWQVCTYMLLLPCEWLASVTIHLSAW